MLLTVLLVVLVISLAVWLARAAFAHLDLDIRETLLWLGLAELPAQSVPRRPRTTARDHGLV